MEMESPESSSSKSTSIPTTDTEIVQDSPVFNFISNLSPIQPVKATSATQGFPGLNSPPLVFTSPRLIPHSQATYLKRAKFSGLSAAKSSGQDEGCKNDAATDASQTLVTQMSTRLTECIEKASYSNNNVNEQIESPLGCSDQFFTDIVNMDSVDPDISADSSTNKSEHISQAPDAVNSTRQIDELHKDDASIYVSGLETDRKQEDSVSEKEPELPIENAPINHDQEEAENVEMEQAGLSDKSSYLTSGSVPIDKEFKGFGEVSETASAEQGAKKVQNNSKALQHRGIRRRCLQFEDAQRNVVCNQPVQTHLDSDGPTSQSLETPPTPINVNQAGAIQPVSHPRSKNSGPKIPKPSGIGLHLNSIINSVQPGSCAIINGKSSQRGTFSIRGKRSVPMINAHEFDNSNISASPDDDENESHATMAANISTSLSPHIVEPSVICNSLEGQPTPGNKRKCDPESDGGSLEFKSSSQKKRKKLSDSSDGDGCKRCNCKKTKCLKLYCDCFAAGIYCADACSCQGCFNRPQFEDIVLETRQQIETRNPLAFAPKVVQQIVEPPASSSGQQDGTQYTPASARHKRGCNCKKSMCLKKYCECYQANVGCSDGCRCEGCKNVFGKKEGYGIIKHVLNEEDTTEQTDGSFIRIMAKSEIELYERNPHHLTPVTPALQSSNPENDASKAWLQSGKYFQSLESELPYEASYMMSPGSPGNSENNAILSETATEFIDRMSFDQVYGSVEMGLQYSVPNSHEWANNSSAGSVRWRGSPDTPMGGSKLIQNSEFDSDLSNLMLDDTPEILKDDPTPTNAVKVTSPNKKRVSPPHSRPLNFSSSSSTGVRTGRKFILKAVPSFPPLTPCINSKNVQTNDSQNCSGKK